MAPIGTELNRPRQLRLHEMAALALGLIVALGTVSVSARPDDHRGDRHDRGGDRHWGGGYYHAPPVVYGSPYYAAPPVVYGPGVGLNIHIR
jgi:hypothetical protein